MPQRNVSFAAEGVVVPRAAQQSCTHVDKPRIHVIENESEVFRANDQKGRYARVLALGANNTDNSRGDQILMVENFNEMIKVFDVFPEAEFKFFYWNGASSFEGNLAITGSMDVNRRSRIDLAQCLENYPFEILMPVALLYTWKRSSCIRLRFR